MVVQLAWHKQRKNSWGNSILYQVKIAKAVYKFIASRSSKKRVTILEAFEKISSKPFDNELDIKKLINKKNHYRLRIGKYRILYEIREKEILIYFYKADSRGGIYKNKKE